MFPLLPNELILNIIYQACTYSADDSRTLGSLSRVSHKINKLMHDNRGAIIEYYTLIEVEDNCTEYLFCDQLHRDNDQPATIYANGMRKWYWLGKLHRDNDQPAVIYTDGMRKWYWRGNLHRDNDLPAVIHNDGSQQWYQHGKIYRDNDKPAIIYADGTAEYWVNDQRVKQ